MRQFLKHILAVALCAQLVACGTDNSSGDQDSNETTVSTEVTLTQAGSTGNPSSISLRLADAPIDNLVRAMVRFTAVELKRQSGGWVKFTLQTPLDVDLLQLQGGKTADLLINVIAEADDYKEIRLYTDSAAMANFVELSTGGTQPLQIPGGSAAGLILRQDFTITSTRAASFIVDFDLRQSIRSPDNSGNYQFKPVMRLIAAVGVGNIRGTVDSALLTAGTCSDVLVDTFNAAYIFNGHGVTPDDINQLSPGIEPFATGAIAYDSTSNSYLYTASFLPAGDYTIAMTCNADLEDLDADDDLLFFNVQNITVLANNTLFL